jgi:hypothetical protein
MNRLYRLTGPDGRPYESKQPGVLGGHRGNRIYGELDCHTACAWIEKGHYVKQRVFFASEADALDAGYRPCARCRPDDYAQWKADPERFRTSVTRGPIACET